MPEHHHHNHHGGHHGGNQHIDIHIDTHEKRGADCMDIFLSFFLPPVAIMYHFGTCCCRSEFWICLLLTLCGILPGIIYALCIVTG